MFVQHMYRVHMAFKNVYRACSAEENTYRAYIASKACAGLIWRTCIEGLYGFSGALGVYMVLQYMYRVRMALKMYLGLVRL